MVYCIAIAVLLINVPFGYWRKEERKFSFNWFLAIHVPVAISIGIRMLAGIEFRWTYLVLFVAAFITGQILGKILHSCLKKQKEAQQNCLHQ